MNDLNYNAIFNDSYARVTQKSDAFLDLFYDYFIDSSPQIKNYFKNTDFDHQKKMLKKSIAYLISFSTTQKIEPYLARISEHHTYDLGINSDFYEVWMKSLLQAIQKFDSKFDHHTEIAWRTTFSPGLEFMKHHKKKDL